MEKSFEEVLVQFYVDQYRENAKRSTGKPVKLAHYIHTVSYTHLDVYKRQDEHRQ